MTEDLNIRLTGDALSGAALSKDGLYRYSLVRVLGEGTKTVTFVMLNPSTADHEANDPTIRRCIGYAKREGASVLCVVNLYALRSTEPSGLWQVDDPVGPANTRYQIAAMRAALESGGTVICGWGVNAQLDTANAFRRLCADNDWTPHHLGLSKEGYPRHPLYLAADKPLVPWLPTDIAN